MDKGVPVRTDLPELAEIEVGDVTLCVNTKPFRLERADAPGVYDTFFSPELVAGTGVDLAQVDFAWAVAERAFALANEATRTNMHRATTPAEFKRQAQEFANIVESGDARGALAIYNEVAGREPRRKFRGEWRGNNNVAKGFKDALAEIDKAHLWPAAGRGRPKKSPAR